MDDPQHVDQRMVGATPPATYDLKPREKLFHGVRALRLTPTEGTSALGRVGLLTHNYMLGPRGDSNGCVSIKDYDRFLKAWDNGGVQPPGRGAEAERIGDRLATRAVPTPDICLLRRGCRFPFVKPSSSRSSP